ncbi:HAD family phosphatase [Tropicibacter sp. Alg240-R139]|uniref:HAD family hydrolase n=1 Tax=Tropicibacter sp. Alg240-R139 TaxID=2305991 RepID=UPI0013E09941|nr:HAD family phosphatase [Tropicibacter sp. Alg240-R139]
MFDLVIFDCDGVLVDSEVVSNQVLVDNLARYGLTLTLKECMGHFVGGTMTGVMVKAREMGADLPEGWIDEIYAETYAGLKAGVPLVRGIPEVLACLDARDIPYCVASNGSREKMKITLGQNGLWDRFEPAMFSAHELGVGKPEPDLFLAAVEHFGAMSPAVIEDSASGTLAAQRAGMRCFGYAEHDDDALLAANGAHVFHDMAELPSLLEL